MKIFGYVVFSLSAVSSPWLHNSIRGCQCALYSMPNVYIVNFELVWFFREKKKKESVWTAYSARSRSSGDFEFAVNVEEWFATSDSIWQLCLFMVFSRDLLKCKKRLSICSRDAYSCSNSARRYFGSLRQILIASFWICWSRRSWIFGAERKAILPYSLRGRT